MMHVIDALDFRMRLDRHRLEAGHLAHHDKRRLQRRQRLHRRGRAHVFVLGQNGEAVDVLYRHHRILEAALVPRLARALLALHRIGIDVVARKPVLGGDQIGRHALRHEIGGTAIDGSIGHAPPEAPMPTRLMDSAPPPMVMACWPDMIWAAAKFTASRPEAQKRLICTPGTLSPRPAFSAAKRAMSEPASPTGSTTPSTTSSTTSSFRLLRSLSALSGAVASASAVTSCSAPSALPRPRGVRT